MPESGHEDAEVVGLLTAPPAVQLARITAWGLGPATLLLMMNACENRCFFCANDGVLRPPPAAVTRWSDIGPRLELNRALAVRTLCIVGTEPALHADFDRALALARDVGFTRVELMTSGLRLAEPGVAERWFAAGIRSVAVPMYGATADVHDSVVGTRSFDRTVHALDRARAAGIAVRVHSLALSRTLPALPGLVQLVADRWGDRLAVAPVRPKESLFDYAAEAPTLDAIAAAVEPLDVSLVGFPSCVAPTKRRGAALVIQLYFRGQTTGFAEACAPCALRATCPGIVLAEMTRARVAPFTP